MFVFSCLAIGALFAVVFLLPFTGRGYETVSVPSVGAQITAPNDTGNLQSELREFANVYSGDYSVAVSDPTTGESASINADRTFDAASLAKLPVLMTLYREAASGDIDLDEKIAIQPSDMQNYGSGVLNTYSIGYEMSLRDCAKALIKESDNTAWVMLERRLGKRRIASELQLIGADDTDYATYTTTPEDVLVMLEEISNPRYTSPEYSKEMLSFMTDTAYEDRLPASLPDSVRVAHKVGTWESTFSDAGIVSRTGSNGSDYYIVVVSSGVEENIAREAIRDTSEIAYGTL